MKEFDIEFEVNQKILYKTSVKADTPEKAIQRLKDSSENDEEFEAEEDTLLDSWDDYTTAKCVGERITDPDGSSRRIDLTSAEPGELDGPGYTRDYNLDK